MENEILSIITPKWESQEILWSQVKKDAASRGSFYHSTTLSGSDPIIYTDLQNKKGSEVSGSTQLNARVVAENFINNIFVVEKVDDITDERIKIISNRFFISDKNIPSQDCFKSAVLYEITFEDISLLGINSKFGLKIKPKIQNILGLSSPAESSPTEEESTCTIDNLCSPSPQPTNSAALQKNFGKAKSNYVGSNDVLFSGLCDPVLKTTGQQKAEHTLIECPVPSLKTEQIVGQTYKDWEDEEIRTNCEMRVCAIDQIKGETKFVGNQIVPSDKPKPCGDLDNIDSVPELYQEIINKYGMDGLLRKAAQCAGLDLTSEEVTEQLLLVFLAKLPCEDFRDFVNATINSIGIKPEEAAQKFWSIGEIKNSIINNIKPVLSKLPPDKINQIVNHPKLAKGKKYIGIINDAGQDIQNDKVPVKMPQEVEDTADFLKSKEVSVIFEILSSQGELDNFLLVVCETSKKFILQEIVNIIKQIDLDKIGTPNIDFEFDTDIFDAITKIKGFDSGFLKRLFDSSGDDDFDWSKFADVDWESLGDAFSKVGVVAGGAFVAIGAALSKLGDIDFTIPNFKGSPSELDFDSLFSDIDFSFISNIDFDNIFDGIASGAGSLFDKLSKISNLANIKLPDFSGDIFSLDFLNINPLGKLPNIPGPEFDFKIPTVDLLAGVSEGTAAAIRDAVSQSTLTVVKEVLRTLCETCEQGNPGDLSIGDLIGESSNKSFTTNKTNQLKEKLVRSVSNILEAQSSPQTDTTIANDLDNFLEDASSILKPGEVGTLILGSAPQSVTDAIQCLVDSRYNNLSPAMVGPSAINGVFSEVGDLVDKNILAEKINNLSKQTAPYTDKEIDVSCPPVQETYDRNGLVDRGVPPDQIEKQIKDKKRRSKKKFRELAELIAKDNPLDDIVPPTQCTTDASGRKNPSLQPNDPESFTELLTTTINTIYDGVYMSFNKDISNFVEAVTVKVPDKVNLQAPAGKNIPAPPAEPTPGEINVLEMASNNGGTKTVVSPQLRGYFEELIWDGSNSNLFQINNQEQEYTLTVKKQKVDPEVAAAAGLDPDSSEELNIVYKVEDVNDINKEKYTFSLGDMITGSSDSAVANYVTEQRQIITSSLPNINEFSPVKDYENYIISKYKNETGVLPSKIAGTTNYGLLFRNILKELSISVSESELFNSDILSLVNFVPQLTPLEKKNNCSDPHPLDLQKIKKDVASQYEENRCDEALVVASGQAQASALDEAGIGGIIMSTIRLYLIEVCLQGAFALSRIPPESEDHMTSIIDNLVSSYSVEFILSNLNKADKAYSFEFQRQTILYHNKISKKQNWEKTSDIKVAVTDLVSTQIKSVLEKMLNIFGSQLADQESASLQIILKDILPYYDLANTIDDRRFLLTNATVDNGQTIVTDVFPREEFENGNIIIERYINKEIVGESENDPNYGFVSIDNMIGILEQDDVEFVEPPKFGLRILYVPPIDASQESDTAGITAVLAGSQIGQVSKKEKAYQVEESLFPGSTTRRKITTIPLAQAEIELGASIDYLNLPRTINSLEQRVIEQFLSDDTFKFLFEYCFPIKRMGFLLMLYSAGYFVDNLKVQNLFGNTKEQLKSTFLNILNVNDPFYEDENIKNLGGNKALSSLADNNQEIPGFDLASFAAKTPLLILKGLAEISDPNIVLAKKIHDAALLRDVYLPMPVASMAALPMNIIPLGIGPPITPTGLAYLATGAATALLSPKEKELLEKELKEKNNLDLSKAKGTPNCDDPNSGGNS